MPVNELITGTVKLSVNGQPIEMTMTVPTTPIKPQRMLPVFQQMTNSIVDISVKAVEEHGRVISCKAGCGACCRQLVPITEVEVYHLAELVENMAEPRRSEIKRRFASAVAHFKDLNWFERIKKCIYLPKPANPDYVPKEVMDLTMEYFDQGIPCPFLEDESCSIHADRPLACREYLVTSPAANCSKPSEKNIEKLRLVFKPSGALSKVGRTKNLLNLGVVPLIRALEFAETFPDKLEEKTGEQWATDFFKTLTGKDAPAESD